MATMQIVVEISGIEEIKDKNLWKAVGAELFGTGFLVLVGCGSASGQGSSVQIALCFGFIVAIMVQATAHISGGHINPAITVGLTIARKISIIRAILYIIAQLVGAIIGAAILMGLLPDGMKSSLGQTTLHPLLSEAQGFGIELLITFVLVFTVLTVTDPNRTDLKGSAPLAIGLSVAACHLWAIRYTGCSMNTARSFGPAIISNNWANHWVYWVGPILGGIIAGLLYHFVFSAPKLGEKP